MYDHIISNYDISNRQNAICFLNLRLFFIGIGQPLVFKYYDIHVHAFK